MNPNPVRSKNSTRLLPGTGLRWSFWGANREKYAKRRLSITRKVTEATSEDDHHGLVGPMFWGC
jgi:hypothetical protein